MPQTRYQSSSYQAVLTRFLVIFIPFMLILAVAVITHYYTENRLLQVKQENTEASNVTLGHQGLVGQMRSVISDLTFLAKLNDLLFLLDTHDEIARMKLAQEFLYFSENKGIYDQVAFIDANGNEIIRVNYGDGIPYIVSEPDLENRADTEYFQEAIKQELGGIYMSSFSMEEDDPDSDLPPRAVIRFATPLFDSQGDKQGLLLLNIRGDTLLSDFRQAAREITDHAYIITNEGHALSQPSRKGNADFHTVINHDFVKQYPSEWGRILQEDYGIFSTQNGLFTFATVYPLVSVLEFYSQTGGDAVSSVYAGKYNAPRYWKIVSHIPPEKRVISYQDFLKQNIWLYSFISLFLLAFSFVLALLSIKRDVAKAQKEYENRLRNTLDAIQFLAVTISPHGRVIYCNEPLLATTGWRGDQLLDRDWFETVVPEPQRAGLKAAFDEVMRGKAPLQTTEYEVTTASGKRRLISWNNIISFCPDGKVMTLTSIGHDITEQRENEKQLHKLSRAVEQTHESIIITDAEGRIEYVNRGFEEITGYTKEEALGQTCAMLKSGETSQEVYEALWHTIKNGREWRGVFRNRRKNGELYWENTTISPIRNDATEITHFLAIKEDVTEHRRLREEVEQQNRELARAQSLAEMGRMASMIAHDLRNPLSSIKMSLQIFQKKPHEIAGDHVAELSAIGLEQVRYMENILADLLLFSKPDALQPEWLQINNLLDASLAISQRTIHQHKAKIITDYHAALPTIHADETKLQQVFSNLIVNAIQACESSHTDPVIQIRTYLDVSNSVPLIHIEICDNGPGIDEEQAEKLFEPFYTTRAKGTGLGLPIVKRMLDQHGGTIKLYRRTQGGSCAHVTLPTHAHGLPRSE